MDGRRSPGSGEQPPASQIADVRAIALHRALLIGHFIATDNTPPALQDITRVRRHSPLAAGFRNEGLERSATSMNPRGDRVEAGGLIGFSGNSGYSQNPHLHFDVIRVDENLEWQTVDVRFAIDRPAGFRPESGQVLNGGARQIGVADSAPGPAAISSTDPRPR